MHGHMNIKLYYDAPTYEYQIILRCTDIWISNYITMHGHMNIKSTISIWNF